MFFHKRFDLTPEEAKQRLLQEDVYLLDVRSIEEYQEGHIPHAHLIPLPELAKRLVELPKNQSIFVYCRSGQRANQAKKLLCSSGFTSVYNIGGVVQWKDPLQMKSK